MLRASLLCNHFIRLPNSSLDISLIDERGPDIMTGQSAGIAIAIGISLVLLCAIVLCLILRCRHSRRKTASLPLTTVADSASLVGLELSSALPAENGAQLSSGVPAQLAAPAQTQTTWTDRPRQQSPFPSAQPARNAPMQPLSRREYRSQSPLN